MKPIYLEPDEEITSVIDKLKDLSDHKVAIVVPKNGTLFQSLINLKLLAKEAKEQGKEVVIVSTNRVGQRLAQQVGFTTYNSLGTVATEPEKAASVLAKPAVPVAAPEPIVIDGVQVNQYNPDVPVAAAVETDAVNDEAVVEPAADLPTEEPPPVILDEPVELKESSDKTEPNNTEPQATSSLASSQKVAEDSSGKLVASSQKPEAGEARSQELETPPLGGGGELPPIIPRSIHVAAPKEPFKMPWKSVAIGSVVALILLAVVYLFLPKATINLTLAATAVNPSQDLNVTTKPANGADNTIAGNLLTSTQTDKKTIPATGTKDIGTKATGSITFFNKASSASVTLASGTTVTASSKTFTLDKAVTIPGATVSGGSVVAGQATGNITASQVGDGSNIKNDQFVISNQPALVYATGSTTGGTTKTVTVLAQADVDAAVAALKADLTTKATEDIKSKAAKQTVLDGSSWLTVTSQTVDQTVGAQVTSANLSMGVEIGEIAFDQSAANNAIKAVASKGVLAGQELIVPSDKPITLTFKALAEDKASMTVTASLNGFIVAKIDKTAVAKSVAHRSKASAITLIKNKYQAEEVRVTFRPSWWPNQLPYLHQAIQVQYNFQEAAPPATTK